MGLKQFMTDFAKLGEEATLRFDFDFIDYNKLDKEKTIPFKELFTIEITTKKERELILKQIEDKDFFYCEIGDLTQQEDLKPVKLNFKDRNELNENYFNKIGNGDIQKASKGDILLSKVRPNLKKYILIDDEYENYYFTTAFIRIKPKKLNKILYYALHSIFYKNLIAIAREGKGYPSLKESDLYYLKFDKNIIEKLESQQDIIMNQIEPIEKEIKQLRSQLKNTRDIINEIFTQKFGFEIAEKTNDTLIFDVNLYDIASKSMQIRSSTHFHQPKMNSVLKKIEQFKTVKLKQLLQEPIRRGVQPEYADGDVYVVKTININKDGNLDLTNAETVSKEFYNKVKTKAGIKNGDILITSMGEGRGKISLYDSDKPAIIDTTISIVRCKNDVNKQYLSYFLLSSIGKNQLIILEQIGKGISQIYPQEIEKILVLYPQAEVQKNIVKEVKEELDKQEKIKIRIQKLRDEIDQIIKRYTL